MSAVLFILAALLILALECALLAEIRIRRNWPRDELEAEVFIDVIQSIKRDIAKSGRPMAGAR